VFKTIWQPVPKWDISIKKLSRAKYPLRQDEYKRSRQKNEQGNKNGN